MVKMLKLEVRSLHFDYFIKTSSRRFLKDHIHILTLSNDFFDLSPSQDLSEAR